MAARPATATKPLMAAVGAAALEVAEATALLAAAMTPPLVVEAREDEAPEEADDARDDEPEAADEAEEAAVEARDVTEAAAEEPDPTTALEAPAMAVLARLLTPPAMAVEAAEEATPMAEEMIPP